MGKQKSRCEHLERHRKTVLSAIMEDKRAEVEASGKKAIVSQLEHAARASQGYRDHCKLMYESQVHLVELETTHFSLRNELNALIEGMKLARAEAHLQQKA